MQEELLQTHGASMLNQASDRDGGPLHSAAAGHVEHLNMVSHPMSLNIVELEVSKMEEQRYYLKIECQKAPNVLVQLTRALEALHPIEIISALVASVSDHVNVSIVVKVKEDHVEEALEAEELKSMLLEVTSKFGLCLSHDRRPS